jgi:hypothetical protein
MIYSMNDSMNDPADNIAIQHTDDTVYIDEAYVIGSSPDLFTNGSPCVKCEYKTDCSSAVQSCQAYRKYVINGKFATVDVGNKFKGLK